MSSGLIALLDDIAAITKITASSLDDVAAAFRLAFANRCDAAERPLVAELFQRCFNAELSIGDDRDALY